MSGPYDPLKYRLAELHHQELIREATNERMIREAFRDESRPAPLFARMLRWLRQRYVAWKASVLRREVAAADVSRCLSPCPE